MRRGRSEWGEGSGEGRVGTMKGDKKKRGREEEEERGRKKISHIIPFRDISNPIFPNLLQKPNF